MLQCGMWCSRADVGVSNDTVCDRFSGRVRGGGTGHASSVWASDSSLVCNVASGLRGSFGMVASVGGSVGSMSGGMSYGVAACSSVDRTNVISGGGGSLSLSGTSFGNDRSVFGDALYVSRYYITVQAILAERYTLFGVIVCEWLY